MTGLPQDVDHEELRDHFKKFGLISESIDDNEKRVKLYNDKDGNFKGEALISAYRPPRSVLYAHFAAQSTTGPSRSASPSTWRMAPTSRDVKPLRPRHQSQSSQPTVASRRTRMTPLQKSVQRAS